MYRPNNTGNNFEEIERDILEYDSVRILMIIIYVVTIIIGVLGNGAALKNVGRISTPSKNVGRISPSLRGSLTSTNTLLCSLFIFNLFVLLVLVPVKMLTGLSQASASYTIISSGLCGFFGYISYGTGIMLLWIHCLLGAERCLAVLKPIVYKKFCTRKAAFQLLAGASFVCAIASLFIPFRTSNTLVLHISSTILPNETYTRLICDYSRDESSGKYSTHAIAFSICLLIFLIIPVVGTIISYILAVAHLKVLMRNQETATSKIKGSDEVALRQRFIITMLVVLATYVFGWTPLIAFESYRIIGGDVFFQSCVFANVTILWHVYFICAIAPYIFCGSSPAFRRSVQKLICRRCTETHPNATPSSDIMMEDAAAV